MDVVKSSHVEPPAIISLGGSLTSTKEVNSSQKQKRRRKQKKHSKANEHTDEGPDFSRDNSSPKTDDTVKDPLYESPDIPDLLSCQRILELNSEKKIKKKKKRKTGHTPIKSNIDDCVAAKDSFSTEASTPALDMPSERSIQSVSTDQVHECSTIKDPLHESPDMPDLLSSQKIAELNSENKTKRKKKRKTRRNAVENNADDCVAAKDTFSTETCTPALDMPSEHPILSLSTDPVHECNTIKVPLHESPDVPNLLSCQRTGELNSEKKIKKKKRKTRRNAIESNIDDHVAAKGTCSTETSTPALDMPAEHPIQSASADPVHECDTIKDRLHESPEIPDVLSSQRIAELNSKEKIKMKRRRKTIYNAIESNVDGCVAAKDTFSTETSTLALDMHSEHPVQSASTDPLPRQSCAGRDFCLEENEGKEQNMLRRAAGNHNEEHDIQELCSTNNSVVVNAEGFEKESVLEVVEFNIERGINDNSSYPEDKNDFVKNASMMKKHDDCRPVCHISQKFQNLKTYMRRRSSNPNYGRNNGYPSSVNCNTGPTLQDHYQDNLHKFSDEQLTVGLMEKETKLSRDQVTSDSGTAAEEMKLTTEGTSEQRFVTTSSAVGIPVVRLVETNGRQLDRIDITRTELCSKGDVADLSKLNMKDDHSKISHFSLDRTIISNSKRKLLVLDVNGLLADIVNYFPRGYKPDLVISQKAVFKRPFCDDFLQFCFDRFHVGVWSSRTKRNVDIAIEFLMGKFASKLLFCWNQSHCTHTKFKTVENKTKPLVLKELRKLWEKLEPGLPWEKGVFNESNTLLLDDSPYKALGNPMYTAIFPYSYEYSDTNDASLGPGGDLRVYLECLAMGENVPEYVASNPFGQRAITESNPSWGYYCKVIDAVKSRKKNARPTPPGRE